MAKKWFPGIIISVSLLLGVLVVYLSFHYRMQLLEFVCSFYDFLTDRDRIKEFVSAFGVWAPAVFILFQFLQVLFAPFPGEATGFIGGYLFGAFFGFLYSSIALTAGSWLNFFIGRYFGKKYIRKFISRKILDRFEPLLKRQGVIVLFVLFIFPGFPKDYLCLFLGLTTLPLKVFIIISSIGRMPGTLMLSLQGAYVYEQMYGLFILIFGISAVVVVLSLRYRDTIYRWIEKFNGDQGQDSRF
jgi:uncharacterized membrane protein YdjX (TVP38/TMEM64 family)